MLIPSSKQEYDFLSFCFFSLFVAGAGTFPSPDFFAVFSVRPAFFFIFMRILPVDAETIIWRILL